MRLRLLMSLALLTLAGVGCSHQEASAIPNGKLSDSDYQSEVAQNQLRLAGEDATLNQEAEGSVAKLPAAAIGDAWTNLVTKPIGGFIDYISGDTPGRAARKAADQISADNRRNGTLRLTDWNYGRAGTYLNLYRGLAANDPDFTVRAAAIRALNRSRDKGAVDIFIHAIDDDEVLVRMEAAKAMANIPDEKEVSALVAHLQKDVNTNVRIACADALRNFKTNEVARNLIQMLDDHDFGVAWQARQSLTLLTAHDYGYDSKTWLNFLSENKDVFG